MKSYVSTSSPLLAGGRSLKELKNLEWIFIGIHSLGVPAAILMATLHAPSSVLAVSIIAGLLALWNVIAVLLNHRTTTIEGQLRLGAVTQVMVVLFAGALIFQVVSGENTAAYSGFAVVIIEGAIRFGLRGSLILGIVFAFGLALAMWYREWQYGLEFNVPGYVFWTVLLFIIALSVGLVTEETRKERRTSELLIRERTLLDERQRIARDLHDSVLKTLHGLALEAHALKKRIGSPDVLEKIEYIEEICQRSSQGIRDMISELRSEEQSVGIAALMAQMVEEWGKTADVEAQFSFSGEDRILSVIATYNVRNVLSEALLNIKKHAEASKVDVSLELLSGELRLDIADNGKGLGYSGSDVYGSAAKGHYGILGMKERIEQLNGQFSIYSTAGTRLLISVPLVKAK